MASQDQLLGQSNEPKKGSSRRKFVKRAAWIGGGIAVIGAIPVAAEVVAQHIEQASQGSNTPQLIETPQETPTEAPTQQPTPPPVPTTSELEKAWAAGNVEAFRATFNNAFTFRVGQQARAPYGAVGGQDLSGNIQFVVSRPDQVNEGSIFSRQIVYVSGVLLNDWTDPKINDPVLVVGAGTQPGQKPADILKGPRYSVPTVVLASHVPLGSQSALLGGNSISTVPADELLGNLSLGSNLLLYIGNDGSVGSTRWLEALRDGKVPKFDDLEPASYPRILLVSTSG